MPSTEPFESHTDRYERWFDANEAAYRSELTALKQLVSAPDIGLEIGVGTGRFAAPLGFGVGLDPATAMLSRALERGVDGIRGVAEQLPFADGRFESALIVTTICFVDDVSRTLAEAERVLEPSGALVLGYIDKDTAVARRYREHQAENLFYREATFRSTDELVAALETVGFSSYEFVQTIFQWPVSIDEPEPVESGYGEGSFVGLRAER